MPAPNIRAGTRFQRALLQSTCRAGLPRPAERLITDKLNAFLPGSINPEGPFHVLCSRETLLSKGNESLRISETARRKLVNFYPASDKVCISLALAEEGIGKDLFMQR